MSGNEALRDRGEGTLRAGSVYRPDLPLWNFK